MVLRFRGRVVSFIRRLRPAFNVHHGYKTLSPKLSIICGSGPLGLLVLRVLQVPGFTVDKCLQIARSKEMAEVRR